LSDWSYEHPQEVVSDPDQAEVDRLLQELFPRTNGGVQNHFYSDPNMPPVPQMPELHPDAETVLDSLDGACLPARAAAAIQERRARREEEAREAEIRAKREDGLEQQREAARAERARKAAEEEEARRTAEAERHRIAMEAVRAAAEADRLRIAEEEAKRAEERRLTDEAAAEADRVRISEQDARHGEKRRLALEAAKAGAEADRARPAGGNGFPGAKPEVDGSPKDKAIPTEADGVAGLTYYSSARDPLFENYYQLLCRTVIFAAYPSSKMSFDHVHHINSYFQDSWRIIGEAEATSLACRCYWAAAFHLLLSTEGLATAQRSYAVECISRLTAANGRQYLRRRLDDQSQAITYWVSLDQSIGAAAALAANRSALLDERHPYLDEPGRNVAAVCRAGVPQPARHNPAFHDAGRGRAPLPAGSRGHRKGRPRRVEEQIGDANVGATVGQVPPVKTWAAPVVVPTQAQPPEVPPPASDVAAAAFAADPVSRSEDGGRQDRADNVVQFPGSKRLSPGSDTLQPDTGAAQPKRRGRPPGSKNRVRPPPSHSASAVPEARPPTTPVLRTTGAVSPAPALRPLRRLSSSAYPLLTASFPLPSWRSINALRDSWSRSLPYDTDLLEQARSALPSDCIRWRVRNGEVSFSEIVASVMTAGGQGARLLLFHDVHLGVAAIDVRCPRPQLVERWSRCIDAAKASLPAGCEMPSHAVMDQVQRLRVDLTVSMLVECLWEIGLGVAIGPVES
jgi:hypothetical protein